MMEQIQVELQDSMGSDRSIAEAAWTSSSDFEGKQKKTDEQVEKVVNMLADHRHATPFESVVFRFWIKMPIQTDRQHMTHRIASHNGMSGRYRTMPSEFMDVPSDVTEILDKVPASACAFVFSDEYDELCDRANDWYRGALATFKTFEHNGSISNVEYKRLREFFRGVLPQNNMTERVTVMNLRSFANYQKLRNSEHAQPEIRRVAELMLETVRKSGVCPVALSALERNGWQI